MTITISIPWVPQAQVSPNSSASTRTKREHHRANQSVAALAVRSHLARERDPFQRPDTPAIDIAVYWPRHRHYQDLDNLGACCKGIIDGVTRELGFDDRHVVALTVTQARDPDNLGYTSLTIREAQTIEKERIA